MSAGPETPVGHDFVILPRLLLCPCRGFRASRAVGPARCPSRCGRLRSGHAEGDASGRSARRGSCRTQNRRSYRLPAKLRFADCESSPAIANRIDVMTPFINEGAFSIARPFFQPQAPLRNEQRGTTLGNFANGDAALLLCAPAYRLQIRNWIRRWKDTITFRRG